MSKLSFEIGRGEIVCVVGPSGCGKTTALRIATGLIAPTCGEVAFAGAPVKGAPAATSRSSSRTIPQGASALAQCGRKRLARARGDGRTRGGRRERIEAPLKRVGLLAFADEYPSQMSGGMQQRLQIARCLAQEPPPR